MYVDMIISLRSLASDELASCEACRMLCTEESSSEYMLVVRGSHYACGHDSVSEVIECFTMCC